MHSHFLSMADQLNGLEWSVDTITPTLKEYITENALKFGDVFRLFRTALVGTDQGPDLVMMLMALGKEESLRRIRESVGIFNEAVSSQ